MSRGLKPLLLAVFMVVLSRLVLSEPSSHGRVRSYRVDIRMPGVSPKVPEKYLCTYKKLSSRKAFITHYEALATMKTAHHILLFGCSQPAKFQDSWECDMSSKCNGGQLQILFAWARNAAPLTLPTDVGFQVGKDASVNYLVLQVHYARALTDAEKDHSGLRIHFTTAPQPFSAGIYIFSTDCDIPAHAKGKHCDMACKYSSKKDIVPFAYRTHTHSLGRTVSAYRIRHKKWSLIGIGNPQAPQAFYSIDKKKRPEVVYGDHLAARCTYDAPNRTKATHMGSTSHDEMCNFYMMYYTDTPTHRRGKPLNSDWECWQRPSTPLIFPAGSDKKLPGWQKYIGLGHQHHHGNQGGTHPKHPHPATVAVHPTTIPTKVPSTTSPSVKATQFSVDHTWANTIADMKLGQVSGVAVDVNGDLLVFHRGRRSWGENTFDDKERLINGSKIGPISVPTVLRIDVKTGKVLDKWGENMFYLPHGITVDSHNNVWLTDVGAHQILKFKAGNLRTPDLILGKILVPGSDSKHFCKPTDVAVESSGIFYVADGYCNSRIMKFSAKGELLLQWGRPSVDKETRSAPGYFSLPHSLALDEENRMIFVADRENGRIQCFNTDGRFHAQFHHMVFHNLVYAVSFNKANGGTLYAINGPTQRFDRANGFTLNPNTGAVTNIWSPLQKGFSRPHDIACSSDNSNVFVAEIGPNRVWKFTADSPSISNHSTSSGGFGDVIGLVSPVEDTSIVPAIIVVVILAAPILLICVAATIQNIRLRQARRHVMRSLNETSGPRSRCCGGIFATPKYYYDGRKGFDKLIGDDLDSDSDEDVFIRKGAV